VLLLLAPDSFKGSLSAPQVCAAMQRGAARVFPDDDCISIPLADGGEGTLDAILGGANGTRQTARVCDPLGNEIEASWGVLPARRAVIEMAQASGLTLVPETERDALRASSFGTGQLIKAALDFGCEEILIGIGGSATTDGGSGALSALGAKFLDARGAVLPPGGAALNELHAIDLSGLDARIGSTPITILSDVTNPLYGESGAAFIYAPQKGASSAEVKILDSGLQNLARVAAQVTSVAGSTPGAGAAGGMGFGLMAFCNAHLKPGIEVVLEIAGFDEKLINADLVLTGEGALDAQTLAGKTIAGVCAAAKKRGVPVIAFGGKVSLTGEELDALGLLSAFPLADAPLSLSECIARADELLAVATERVLRVWAARALTKS
jgi:glycerate kinase